jgi:hypothetical protein
MIVDYSSSRYYGQTQTIQRTLSMHVVKNRLLAAHAMADYG